MLAHEISHVTQHHVARMMSRAEGFDADVARRARARHPRRARRRRLERRTARRRRDRRDAGARRSSSRSTSRARTSTRPTASASSGSMPPASTSTRWRRSCSACSARCASSTATSPSYLRDHPVTYERIAEAQARAYGHAVPAGRRFARLPPRARAAAQLPGRAARRPSAGSTTRSPSTSTTTRSPRTTASSPRCCAPTTIARAKEELATLEKMAPAAPDDRRDGRSRAARFGRRRRRDQALRGRARALSEQDAARLRLSGRAAQGGPQRARRRVRRAAADPLPRRRSAAQIAARAYAAQNKQMLAARHQAEYYAWQGNLKGAVDAARARVQVERRRLLPGLGRRHPAEGAAPAKSPTRPRRRSDDRASACRSTASARGSRRTGARRRRHAIP